MYVKVVAGDAAQEGFILEVQGPIYSNQITAPPPRTEDDLSDLLDSLGFQDFHQTHLIGVYVGPGQEDCVDAVFRCVYWLGTKGHEAVVTTRNIFIMSDEGKTIDRVS